MNFCALDIETANTDYSSICQIGIAKFENGKIAEKWSTLINPESYFDSFNVDLHGIDQDAVKGAPTFADIHEELNSRLSGNITIHHMPFDRIAISRACDKYDLDLLMPIWLDSAKVVRRTWEQFAYKGYGLSNVASFLEIDFQHHDALEDAVAAGMIVQRASEVTGLSIAEWRDRITKPIKLYIDGSTTIKLEGNPEGPLYGEQIVFTGALSLTRAEAGAIAAELGCNVTNSVTKKTTMLVVGIQDSDRLAGFDKSSKHRKAEDLAQKGHSIKIISEQDFLKILE